MTPKKDRLNPSLNPVMREGKMDGNTISLKIFREFNLKDRPTLIYTPLMSLIEAMVRMMMGNIPWKKPKATFDSIPNPKMNRKIGKRVTLGMA
jgi:hypothetical protein